MFVLWTLIIFYVEVYLNFLVFILRTLFNFFLIKTSHVHVFFVFLSHTLDKKVMSDCGRNVLYFFTSTRQASEDL